MVTIMLNGGVSNPIRTDLNRIGKLGLDVELPPLPLPVALPEVDVGIPDLLGGKVEATL